MTTEDIKKAAKKIKEATAIVFLSGAGMGVDSGLPDFRGKEGFWKAYPPMQKLGLEFSQMSTPSWFVKDPEFAWGFWTHRYNLYTSKKPHEGYHIIKRFTENKKDGYFDGHNEQLFPLDHIYECHGGLLYWQCSDYQCKQPVFEMKNAKLEHDENFRNKDLPKCPTCGEVSRPNVLMFGDFSFKGERINKQYVNYNKFQEQLEKNHENVKLVCIEIGAGTAIPTVREEGEYLCEKFDGTLIRINLRDDEIPKDLDAISLPLGGLDALTKIEEEIKKLE